MCGRFTQQRPTSEIAAIFEAEDIADDPGGRFNVAPTDAAAVVVQRDDRRAVVSYRWGLIPGWSDDRRIASRTFNARAETVASNPVFRDAFRRRRCLVPVDGFYEWLRDGSKRQPMRIHDPDDRPLALDLPPDGSRPLADVPRRQHACAVGPSTRMSDARQLATRSRTRGPVESSTPCCCRAPPPRLS